MSLLSSIVIIALVYFINPIVVLRTPIDDTCNEIRIRTQSHHTCSDMIWDEENNLCLPDKSFCLPIVKQNNRTLEKYPRSIPGEYENVNIDKQTFVKFERIEKLIVNHLGIIVGNLVIVVICICIVGGTYILRLRVNTRNRIQNMDNNNNSIPMANLSSYPGGTSLIESTLLPQFANIPHSSASIGSSTSPLPQSTNIPHIFEPFGGSMPPHN